MKVYRTIDANISSGKTSAKKNKEVEPLSVDILGQKQLEDKKETKVDAPLKDYLVPQMRNRRLDQNLHRNSLSKFEEKRVKLMKQSPYIYEN